MRSRFWRISKPLWLALLFIYSKARAFKAKANSSRPRPENPKAKATKFGLKAKD